MRSNARPFCPRGHRKVHDGKRLRCRLCNREFSKQYHLRNNAKPVARAAGRPIDWLIGGDS